MGRSQPRLCTPSRRCCTNSQQGAPARSRLRSHTPIATDFAAPSSNMRFRRLQPSPTSTFCASGPRARRRLPRIRWYRKNVFSARPCLWLPTSFFHWRLPTSCTRTTAASLARPAGESPPDRAAVLEGGTTTVAPRAARACLIDQVSYAPSAVKRAILDSTWSSKSGTTVQSSIALSVSRSATMTPFASTPTCSFLQARMPFAPCLAAAH